MLKRFLLLILIIFIGLISSASAFASSKITNVTFDNSDKIIFLSAQNDEIAQNVVPQKIKLVKLENPTRVYFDLPDTVLTMKNTAWKMNYSVLKEVKVAQTSKDPNVVRVVITADTDLSKMVVMQLPMGYLIRYNTGVASKDYLSEIYRDVNFAKGDYYEKVSFVDSAIVKAESEEKDLVNKIDEAFNKMNNALSNTSSNGNIQKPQKETNIIPIPAQNLSVSNNFSKIKTKYYLNRIDIKKGNILVSGVGSASLEKVKVLTEPNRVVYDIPNAVLNPNLRNNEYKISDTESVRLGQFEQSKVRIVIVTNDVSKYKPIFSQDMQGILFAHSDRMENVRLFDHATTINSYGVKHTNNYDMLALNMTAPVVQSVVRDYDKLSITLYNAKPISADFFKTDINSTMFKNIKVSKIASTDKFQAGLMFTIPVDKYDTIYVYESQNAGQLVVKIEPQQVINKVKIKTEKQKVYLAKNEVIVIDPGHGGPDVGATRNNVFEKDINLDVAKRVYDILTKAGYKVEMTRTNDVNPTLQERCDFANERKTALFVSIHTNASVNEAANGVETHFYKEDSIELASIIHKHLVFETKANDRGTIKSMFYVVNHTNVPSVLVEMGYISNELERDELQTEQRKDKTATAIAEGIVEYLKGAH